MMYDVCVNDESNVEPMRIRKSQDGCRVKDNGCTQAGTHILPCTAMAHTPQVISLIYHILLDVKVKDMEILVAF